MSVVAERRDTPADVYAVGSRETYIDAVENDEWSQFTPAALRRRALMMRWLRENGSPEALSRAVMRGDIAWELLQGLAARKGAQAAIEQLRGIAEDGY